MVAVFIVAGGVIASIALLGEDASDHDEPSSVCFASSGSPFVQIQIVPRSRAVPCASPEAEYEAVGPPRAAPDAPQPDCAPGQTVQRTGDGWYCAEPIER